MPSIILSTDEIRALHRGSTMIVRPVKNLFPDEDFDGPGWYSPVVIGKDGEEEPGKERFGIYAEDWSIPAPCAPGDVLDVRETWSHEDAWYPNATWKNCHTEKGWTWIDYKADMNHAALMTFYEDGSKFMSGTTMPPWAVRYHLPITDVRIKRCQEIIGAEIHAIGIVPHFDMEAVPYPPGFKTKKAYTLHESLEIELTKRFAKKGFNWDANQVVWLIEHRRVEV